MHARGFTLAEALVTLVLISIVLAFGVPQFAHMIAAARVTTTTNGLVGLIVSARTNAIMRRGPATLCGRDSEDHSECNMLGQWSYGALLFADRNGDGVKESDDRILARLDVPRGVTVTSDALVLRYQADGSVDGEARFLICNVENHAKPRKVWVMSSGAHYIIHPNSCD